MRVATEMGILAGVVLMAGSAYAQAEQESAATFHRLDFVTRELEENRVVNTRNYSVIVSDKGGNSIRTGTKVPVPTGSGTTYVDVGMNIDCRDVHESQGQLILNVSADISTLLGETQSDSNRPPMIHQYKWASQVMVPLRKATLIYSSDDPASKRKLQVEVTATPVK